ncbi:TKL protein kinase [Pelomyxa schiedti]|nr:TKL protein kinase [Pelomyxa schiedti]
MPPQPKRSLVALRWAITAPAPARTPPPCFPCCRRRRRRRGRRRRLVRSETTAPDPGGLSRHPAGLHSSIQPPAASLRDSGAGAGTRGDAVPLCHDGVSAQQTQAETYAGRTAVAATYIASTTEPGECPQPPRPPVKNKPLPPIPKTATSPPLTQPTVVLNVHTVNSSEKNQHEEQLALLQKQTTDTNHLFACVLNGDEVCSFEYILPVLDVVYASIVSHIHQNRLSAITGTAQQLSSFLAAMQPQIDSQGDLLFSSLHQHLACFQRHINKVCECCSTSQKAVDMAAFVDSRGNSPVPPTVHWKQLPSSTSYFDQRIQLTLNEIKSEADSSIVDSFFSRDLLCATFLYANGNPTLTEHGASTHCTKLLNCYMCQVMHLEKGVRNKFFPIVNDFYLLFKEKWASLPLAALLEMFNKEFLQEKASHQQWDMFMSKYIPNEKLRPPFPERLKRHQLIALSIYVSTLRGLNDSALFIATENRVCGPAPHQVHQDTPAPEEYLKALCNLFLTLASSLKLFFFPNLEDISHPLDLFTEILQNKKKYENMAGTAGSAFPWVLLQLCQRHLQQLLEIQVSLAKKPGSPFPGDHIPRSPFSPEQLTIIEGVSNTVGMMKHFFPIQYGAVCYIRGLLDSSMEAAIDRTSKMMGTSPDPDFSPVNQFHLDFLAQDVSDIENVVEGLRRYNLSSESDKEFTELKKRWKSWLSSFKATATATATTAAKDFQSWLPPNSLILHSLRSFKLFLDQLKKCKDMNKSDYDLLPPDKSQFLPIFAATFLGSLSDGAIESDSSHVIPLKHFYGAFPHRTKVSFWKECKNRVTDEATKVALDKAQTILSSFPSPNGFRPGPFEERVHFQEKLHLLLATSPPSETSPGGNKYTLALAGLSGGVTGDIHPKVASRLQLDQIAEELAHILPARSHNHLVKPVDIEDQVFYFKFFPEIPAYEQAVSLLHDRIIGFGTAKSVFGKLTIRKVYHSTTVEEVYPVLISEKIQGPTFDSYLATGSDRPFPSEMFTKLLIMGLITMPEDGKPDNFIFEEKTGKLVGIDNDRAFSPPEVVVKDGGLFFKTKKLMMVKSVIFCLSQIIQPLDSKACQEFLLLNPMALMKDWIQDLHKTHEAWKTLKITPEEIKEWSGPIFPALSTKEDEQSLYQRGCLASFCLPPDLVDDLFISMSSLQAIMQTASPPLTGLQLLESVMPDYVAKFYIALHLNKDRLYDTAKSRFQKIRELYYHGNSSTVSTCLVLSSRFPFDENGGTLPGAETTLRDGNMLLHEVERDSRVLCLIKNLIFQGNSDIFEKLHGGLQFKIANKLVWQDNSPVVVQKKVLDFISRKRSTQPNLKLSNYRAVTPVTKILDINPHVGKVTITSSRISECSFPRPYMRLHTISIDQCQALTEVNLLQHCPALNSVTITNCDDLQTLKMRVPIESLQELHIKCPHAVNVSFEFQSTGEILQVSTQHHNFTVIKTAAISGDYSLANKYKTSAYLEPNHAILNAAEDGEHAALNCFLRSFPALHPKDRDGCTPLLLAAKKGQHEEVQFLLDKGYSVDEFDNFGKTAISHAVCGGHQATVELLVSRGASLSVRAHDGKTALHLACDAGQLDMAKWLLLHGSTLEERDKLKLTPLMCATLRGHRHVVRWLVEEKHCNIEENDSFDRTALLHAAIGRQLAVIEYLRSKGASMTTKDSEGKTALMLWLLHRSAEAAQSSCGVQYFLEHGLPVDTKDHLSQTAFLLAVEIGDLPTAILLHSRGASLDVSCKRNGDTPLLLAAKSGNLEMFKWLISKSSLPLWEYINQSNDIGDTALLYASQRSHMMKWIAKEARVAQTIARITPTNSLGENAAHQAAGGGHVDALEWLKSQKVPLNARTKDGATPSLVAAFTGNQPPLSWLLNNGARLSEKDNAHNTILMTALYSRHMALVQWLLNEMHAPMTDTNIYGCNCILLAAGCGQVELLNKMKASGVPVLIKAKPYGLTALMYAAMGGNLEAMQWLVGQGAIVAETDAMGNSVISFAAYSGNIQLMEWLTQSPQGLSISQTAQDGSTPQHWSARKGNQPMLEWLLRAGSNLKAESFLGTVLHLACRSGNLLLVRYICDKMYEMGIYRKNINKKNALGNTPLDEALSAGSYYVAGHLREKNAESQANNDPRTHVLHYNIVSGTTRNFLRLLTEAHNSGPAGQAAIRQPGVCHNTLLHLAALFCSSKHVEHLLGCVGGDAEFVNQYNDNGFTALHLAAQRASQSPMVALLVAGGANLTLRTSAGSLRVTALELHMLCHGHTFNLETIQLLGVTDIHNFINTYRPSPPPNGNFLETENDDLFQPGHVGKPMFPKNPKPGGLPKVWLDVSTGICLKKKG